MGLKSYLQTLGDRTLHSTAIRVALIVGTVIFCINHGSAFLHGAMTRTRWTSMVLTYFVPYCVNLHGQIASRMRQQAKAHPSSEP
ncbi:MULTISPECIES: nitrate/nitrite transporter NrtS1 [Cyanophyceae]